MNLSEHDTKVLIKFLEDCKKFPERKTEPKRESDRKFLIRLLNWCYYDIAPRAEEFLKFCPSLSELKTTGENKDASSSK
jgi:hypothetical protein